MTLGALGEGLRQEGPQSVLVHIASFSLVLDCINTLSREKEGLQEDEESSVLPRNTTKRARPRTNPDLSIQSPPHLLGRFSFQIQEPHKQIYCTNENVSIQCTYPASSFFIILSKSKSAGSLFTLVSSDLYQTTVNCKSIDVIAN